MKKTVVYVVILVVLSLAAGVVLGMGIGRKAGYARHLVFKGGIERQGWKGRHGEGLREQALELLSRRLNLSQEQREKIGKVLDDSRAKVENSKKEALKNFTAIKESTNAKIREVLTPKQQVEFDRLESERKAGKGLHKPFGGPECPPEKGHPVPEM